MQPARPPDHNKTSTGSLGIILLSIAMLLHLVVLFSFVDYFMSSDAKSSEISHEEIIIFELVYGVVFAVGLALRQDWARIGLLFNAYFLLILATIQIVISIYNPVARAIQQSLMYQVIILVLLHSPPLRNAVRRKSVAQSYTYTSNQHFSESESAIRNQEKEGKHEDRTTSI